MKSKHSSLHILTWSFFSQCTHAQLHCHLCHRPSNLVVLNYILHESTNWASIKSLFTRTILPITALPHPHTTDKTARSGYTFHWVWETGALAPANNIIWSQEDNTPFGQPTLFCSCTLLPLASENQETPPWPFCAALKSGVYPHCTWREGDSGIWCDWHIY